MKLKTNKCLMAEPLSSTFFVRTDDSRIVLPTVLSADILTFTRTNSSELIKHVGRLRRCLLRAGWDSACRLGFDEEKAVGLVKWSVSKYHAAMNTPAKRSPVCRLAPSPTGAQHLGNARTFLLAYWSARAQNAELILRIEDMDSPRVKPWATEQVLDDLAWLGIDYDGVPIIQTERSRQYQTVLDRMIADDRVYPCTCTRTDIQAAASAPHEQTIPRHPASLAKAFAQALTAETTVYPGSCSGWHRGDPLPDPGSYCWRFRIDPAHQVFTDLVVGRVRCNPLSAIGDFPVTRKEGVAAYQLAVVVDDIDGGVSEVVRGDDLLLSTFRQMQLYEYLDTQTPRYAHVPLVVGEDGRRLAKRHGDTRLSHYREQGIAPESIVAWAARSAMNDATELPNPAETAAWDLRRWHAEMIARLDWSRLPPQQVRYPGNSLRVSDHGP